MEVIGIELLKKLHAQYTVYVNGLKIKSKAAIRHKVRVLKLYKNTNYEYEAIFNIGYINDGQNVEIIRGCGMSEEEAINNLEINILERKEKFLINEIREIFY